MVRAAKIHVAFSMIALTWARVAPALESTPAKAPPPQAAPSAPPASAPSAPPASAPSALQEEAPPEPPVVPPTFPSRPPLGPQEVRFQPDDDQLGFLVVTGATPATGYGYFRHGWWIRRHVLLPSYSRVCTGPCSARFLPGEYDVALEKEGRVVPASERVVITRPSVLHAHYTDYSGLRVAGVVLGIGGVIAGTVMMFSSVDRGLVCSGTYCYYEDTVDGPLLAAGIGVFAASAIAGSIMAWQKDEAHFTISPLRLSSLTPREGLSFARSLPEGAAFTARF